MYPTVAETHNPLELPVQCHGTTNVDYVYAIDYDQYGCLIIIHVNCHGRHRPGASSIETSASTTDLCCATCGSISNGG